MWVLDSGRVAAVIAWLSTTRDVRMESDQIDRDGHKLSTAKALTGAGAPMEEALTEAAASMAAGTLASAGAYMLMRALAAGGT